MKGVWRRKKIVRIEINFSQPVPHSREAAFAWLLWVKLGRALWEDVAQAGVLILYSIKHCGRSSISLFHIHKRGYDSISSYIASFMFVPTKYVFLWKRLVLGYDSINTVQCVPTPLSMSFYTLTLHYSHPHGKEAFQHHRNVLFPAGAHLNYQHYYMFYHILIQCVPPSS